MLNNKHVANVDLIAENFKKYSFGIAPKLATTLKCLQYTSKVMFRNTERVPSESDLAVNELKEAFFLLKTNKSSVYDGINLLF